MSGPYALLPDTRSGLAWTNVYYDIPLPRKQRKAALARSVDLEKQPTAAPPDPPTTSPKPGCRRIIDGVSGHVAQSEFVGLLGASGAGKTTLLNILSARISQTGDLSGTVTYQGKSRDPSTWKRTVGYVEQDDAMLPHLTVRETIDYSARLRLPDKAFSWDAKAKRVEQVIDMLRLDTCESTRIGGDNERGVSGGERKRTSIGVELVSDVSLLFLDEPTSGLDAFAASRLATNVASVVKTRDLACLMTIHQPSWNIFCQLDRVILLAQGAVFYDGPPRETVAYFSALGYDVPEGTNPADHFISIAENAEKDEVGARRVRSLIEAWAARKGDTSNAMARPATMGPPTSFAETTGTQHKEAVSPPVGRTDPAQDFHGWPLAWWKEFHILFSRAALEILRDKAVLIGTIGQTFILLILIGFAFFRLGNSQSDILAKIGVLFFLPINASFAVLFPLIVPFAVQRKILIRERSSGLYRTSSFFLAKVVLEVPNAIVTRVVFYVVIYFMIGLKLTASAFFIFIGINFLQLANAVGLGLAIGAVSPTIDIANIIAPLINVVFLLFGGSFLPAPPPWFVWLKWISPINYAYSALTQNEFDGETFDCAPDAQQCYPTGEAVLSAYNLNRFTIGQNAGFLGAITLVFITAGYLGLRWSARPRFRFVR